MDLESLKRRHIPITVLTAHDYPSARFIESASASITASSPAGEEQEKSQAPTPPAGIDICLVGDSLAMVACGYSSTVPLSLDEMLYHCRSVARGCKTSLLVADMPFGTFTSSVSAGVANATRLIQEGDMDAVKIEGGEEVVELIQRLTSFGIPVMGHVGLTPQKQSALSGYKVQGKTVQSAYRVYQDALAIQEAGAFAVVLEAIPSKLARFISERLNMATIGIGGGDGCDGQVLVQLDMLGISSLAKGPRFLKTYADLENVAAGAVREYVEDVRSRKFPEEKHSYTMPDAEWDGFVKAMETLEGGELHPTAE